MNQSTLFLLLRLLVTSVTMLVLSLWMTGIEVSSFWAALLFAVVMGLINAVIRPVVKVLALPVTILTLGLFSFVINALLFWLASVFVIGVEVQTFTAALIGALVLGLVSWVLNWSLAPKK